MRFLPLVLLPLPRARSGSGAASRNRRMADAFLEHVQRGQALPSGDIEEAAGIVAEVKRKSGDTSRMAELAVKWTLQNPKPMKLDRPAYNR